MKASHLKDSKVSRDQQVLLCAVIYKHYLSFCLKANHFLLGKCQEVRRGKEAGSYHRHMGEERRQGLTTDKRVRGKNGRALSQTHGFIKHTFEGSNNVWRKAKVRFFSKQGHLVRIEAKTPKHTAISTSPVLVSIFLSLITMISYS